MTADSADSESSSKNDIKMDASDHHHQQQQGLVGVVTVASQFHQIPEQYQPQHQQQVLCGVYQIFNAYWYMHHAWFPWMFFASPPHSLLATIVILEISPS